jgi:hypothetical protein
MARKVRSLTPAKGARHIPFLISMSAIFIRVSVFVFLITLYKQNARLSRKAAKIVRREAQKNENVQWW